MRNNQSSCYLFIYLFLTEYGGLTLQVKAVVFDKTGTLTVGKPVVVSAVLFSSFSMEEFCDVTTAAEVS